MLIHTERFIRSQKLAERAISKCLNRRRKKISVKAHILLLATITMVFGTLQFLQKKLPLINIEIIRVTFWFLAHSTFRKF